MLEFSQGLDIVEEIGQVTSADNAPAVLKERLDSDQFARICQIQKPSVLKKIAKTILMCKPGRVMVNSGSADDLAFFRRMALNKGDEAPLAMQGHTLHYDLREEQGRIINRPYDVATNNDEPENPPGLRSDGDKILDIVLQGMQGIIASMNRPERRVNRTTGAAPNGCGKTSKGVAVNNQAGRIAMDLFLMLFITSVLGAIVACYIYLLASKVEVPAELKELTKQIVAYCIGVGSGIGLIHRSAKP